MPEFRRVHCTFCRQTFLTPTLGECSLCRKSGGLVDAGSPAGLQSLVESKRSPALPLAPPVPVSDIVTNPFELWRWFKVAAAGVFLLVLGGFLMTPVFWSDPKRPSLGELAPGLAAGFVGLLLLALAVAAAWPRSRRDGRVAPEAGPATPAYQSDAVTTPNPERSDTP